MSNIQEILKKNRPHLAESSIKVYSNAIINLFKKLHGTGDVHDYFTKNTEKVLEYLNDKPYRLRKTTLAILVSFCGSLPCAEEYRKQMMIDAKQYNDDQQKQQPSEKQTKNWESWSTIVDKRNEYYKMYYPLLKKNELTPKDIDPLVDMIILCLYTMIPPRRNKDYTEFKIKHIDTEHDNYLDKNEFVFNTYKTGKVYNTQRVKIPRKLLLLLKKWISKNDTDYLLINKTGKKLSVSQLTIRLNKLFGKNISTSMLRHIYISDVVLKNVPALTKLQHVAEEMGHSVPQQLEYKKIMPQVKNNTKTEK